MPLFLWKKSYEIRIDEIDAQHRRLVAIINELSDAMMYKRGHGILRHVLSELVEYTQVHFKTEEDFMLKAGYPAFEEHQREHTALTGKVVAFSAEFELSHNLKAAEILEFLCDWLKNHINIYDRDFGEYIKKAGIAFD